MRLRSIAVCVTFLVSALCVVSQTPGSASPDAANGSNKDTTASSQAPHVGRGVSAPRLTHNAFPEYSKEGRQKKIQGTCLLELVVGVDGLAHDIKVVRPLGYGLDEQAVKAVQQWKFDPGRKDGEPVAVTINAEVSFRWY
jgi:periplasmic protein TonB